MEISYPEEDTLSLPPYEAYLEDHAKQALGLKCMLQPQDAEIDTTPRPPASGKKTVDHTHAEVQRSLSIVRELILQNAESLQRGIYLGMVSKLEEDELKRRKKKLIQLKIYPKVSAKSESENKEK